MERYINLKATLFISLISLSMAFVLCGATGCGEKSVSDMSCREYFDYEKGKQYSRQEALRQMGPAYENELNTRIKSMDASGDSEGCKDVIRQVMSIPPGQ